VKTRIMKLTRVRNHSDSDNRTLFFTAPGLKRRRLHMFFGPDAVPEFGGEEAWFQAEQVPKNGWRIVQRVNPDGTPYVEAAARHA
jgi:hypothetical protein